MNISDKEFYKFKEMIYDNFGINLTEQKKGMLYTRLNKLVMTQGFESFNNYYDYIKNDKSGKGLSELINAVSTNHTFFYRESHHFNYFQEKVLPEMFSRLRTENSRDLRIWSAGCSSGEEPYMLTMLMMEYLKKEYTLRDAGVLATDIDTNVIFKAQKGEYSSDKLSSLPPQYKLKYFSKISSDTYKLSNKVINEVTFRRFNLMNKEFPFKQKFHAIFCRNVMIYFDKPTRDNLIKKYFDSLVPGGYFFIGHSETLDKRVHQFEYIMPAAYRKPFQ